MDRLGEFKNQLYNFMTHVSRENPSNEKLGRLVKLMEQMEDVLYEIKKPSINELRGDTRRIIERLRIQPEDRAAASDKKKTES